METYNPNSYEPLAYNDQLEPHKLTDPSWIPFSEKIKRNKTHMLSKVHMLPTFMQKLAYKVVSFAAAKKLKKEGVPDDLIEMMRAFREVSLLRSSVIDIAQCLPWYVPHMIDPEFTLHGPDRLGSSRVQFPIGIAYGDRDFLCSKGADDVIRNSQQF